MIWACRRGGGAWTEKNKKGKEEEVPSDTLVDDSDKCRLCVKFFIIAERNEYFTLVFLTVIGRVKTSGFTSIYSRCGSRHR